jgi:hypothetical protein
MIEIKIVENWDDFKELLFRLSNMGFYVRWTASQYDKGRKGLYLMDFGGISKESTVDMLVERGFEYVESSMTKMGFLHHFVSPSLHS